MTKIKVLLAYKAYPFALASYFRRALERRNDIELVTVGEFFGQSIPWNGGMTIPMKYHNQIDIPIQPGISRIPWSMIEPQLPWTPDLVLNVDAGFHFSSEPPHKYALVATDPHVLGAWYSKVRPFVDYFFNMQPYYMQEGDILLPYAYDPSVHYPEQKLDIVEYDCSIVGLHYPQRDEWVSRLRALGIKVNYRIGDIYDEYREENNKAWIGLNWSSLEDVTARVYEIMAMGLVPILNRLDGLTALGFIEGTHYLGFSDLKEAVAQVQWAMGNRDEAHKIAINAHRFVTSNNHTYDARIQQILQDTGLV